MPDHPPDRIGPFVVLSPIGSGGMGEVFRARDTRLNRDVAIKLLARAGGDPIRHRRFTEEAQAASALNHPNILTVYDVGDHEGTPYIVSELVDGISIRQVIARAPLPIREILDLGVQMAEGLAAAHRAGIVHRDFKPENAMVTREGRVKVLDFGLALAGTSSLDGDVTLTQAGTIVGTVPYMSPEQARGAVVDYRTDQFSLGLTLYELAAGRRAFQADSAAQTLAAILDDEPEAIAKLNPRVPAPLRWIVERCLAKDPRQRYESTTDLARELVTLRDRLTECASVADVTLPAVGRRTGLRPLLAVAAAAAAAALGVSAGRSIDPPAVTLEQYRFTPFATEAGYQSSPAWSPDGKTLAYVAAVEGVQQVFTQAIGSPLRTQATHARFDCQQPFWSPDGTRLYYISLARDREGLWSISAAGGEPDLAMENVTRATISPDGRTLALLRPDADREEGLYSVWLSSPPGTQPMLYSAGGFDARTFVDGVIRFSPDGSKIGLWAIESSLSAGNVRPTFWILPLTGAAPRLASLVTGDDPVFAAPFSWLPDSRHIVSTLPSPQPGAHLWMMDTESDAKRLLTTGGSFESDPAVSPDGARLASAFQEGNYDLYKLSLNGRTLEPVLNSSRNEMDPAWSSAASQLAFTTNRSGADEIWLRSANGDFERPLVTQRDFPDSESYILSSPAFSADGQRIAYYREGRRGYATNRVWVSPVAGGPPLVLDPTSSGEQDLPTWSPDGNWIAYSESRGGFYGKWSLMKIRLGSTGTGQVVVPVMASGSSVKWSPDGAWIAYNGVAGLSLVSPDGQSTRAIDDEPWMGFTWSEDSRQLFGIRLSDDFKHLTFTSVDVESRRERVYWADFLPLPAAARPVRGVTRVSGTTFLTSIIHMSSDIWLLDGFRPDSTLWNRMTARFGLLRR